MSLDGAEQVYSSGAGRGSDSGDSHFSGDDEDRRGEDFKLTTYALGGFIPHHLEEGWSSPRVVVVGYAVWGKLDYTCRDEEALSQQSFSFDILTLLQLHGLCSCHGGINHIQPSSTIHRHPMNWYLEPAAPSD